MKLIDKDALVAEIEKLKIQYDKEADRVIDQNQFVYQAVHAKYCLCKYLLEYIEYMQEEPVSEELKKAAVEAFKEIVDSDKNNFLEIFKAGAEWKKANLWKDAQGDDLPEIDREVIALTQPYQDDDEHLKVVCAHRPSKYAKIWNSDLGEEQVIEVEGYDKGGWNIPDVKFWLDADLPNMEDLVCLKLSGLEII